MMGRSRRDTASSGSSLGSSETDEEDGGGGGCSRQAATGTRPAAAGTRHSHTGTMLPVMMCMPAAMRPRAKKSFSRT